jgi:hypothetical protein
MLMLAIFIVGLIIFQVLVSKFIWESTSDMSCEGEYREAAKLRDQIHGPEDEYDYVTGDPGDEAEDEADDDPFQSP